MSATSISIVRPVPCLLWVKMAWFGGLILLPYWQVLCGLIAQWSFENGTGYGFLAPSISALILWRRWEQIRAIRPRPNWAGLVVVGLGAVLLVLATVAVEIFTARAAFVVSLIGVVWLLGGTGILKKTAFPLFVLFFMIPLPTIVQNQISLFGARVVNSLSAAVLAAVDAPVLHTGGHLFLPAGELTELQTAAGMSSLVSLLCLSLAYGYFFETRRWVRAVLLLASLPGVILFKVSCITTAGMLSQSESEVAKRLLETSSNWIGVAIPAALLVVLHRRLMRTVNWRLR